MNDNTTNYSRSNSKWGRRISILLLEILIFSSIVILSKNILIKEYNKYKQSMESDKKQIQNRISKSDIFTEEKFKPAPPSSNITDSQDINLDSQDINPDNDIFGN